MKLKRLGILLIALIMLISMFCCLGSGEDDDSGYGDYYFSDVDKNRDGNLSDSEFQNAVNAFMDENGY